MVVISYSHMNTALTSHLLCAGPTPLSVLFWLSVARLCQTSSNSYSLLAVRHAASELSTPFRVNYHELSEIVIDDNITRIAILPVQPLPLGNSTVVSAVEY